MPYKLVSVSESELQQILGVYCNNGVLNTTNLTYYPILDECDAEEASNTSLSRPTPEDEIRLVPGDISRAQARISTPM